MIELTKKFVEDLGFIYQETHYEKDFYYEEFIFNFPHTYIAVYFNYFDCGTISSDVTLDGYGLVNVGQKELTTLINILPKDE